MRPGRPAQSGELSLAATLTTLGDGDCLIASAAVDGDMDAHRIVVAGRRLAVLDRLAGAIAPPDEPHPDPHGIEHGTGRPSAEPRPVRWLP